MKMQAHTIGLLGSMLFAIRIAEELGKWVVLVCPEGDREVECRLRLAGAVPPEVKFSGRTALFSGGGRVSVAASSTHPFVPKDEPFSVLFIGWNGDGHDYEGMNRWRHRAKELLSVRAS